MPRFPGSAIKDIQGIPNDHTKDGGKMGSLNV